MWVKELVAEGSKKNEPSAYYNDLISELYDDSWYGTLGAPELDYYYDLLSGGLTALEFPTGTGRLAIPLLERGVEIYGFDNSEDMLARLRRKLDGRGLARENRRFTAWGALNTPYPCEAASFDVAVIAFASFSLMHSNAVAAIAENRIFRELSRVLRPDGIVVLNDYRIEPIDFAKMSSGHRFIHQHYHPIHGEIMEEQISDFKIEPNELVRCQVVRYRKNRLVRTRDDVVLASSTEITPLWDVNSFRILAENAALSYFKSEVVDFYQDRTVNHFFRKNPDNKPDADLRTVAL